MKPSTGSRGWDEYAAFYDWENQRTVGRRDIAFWRRFAAGISGRALELGTGTGRVLVPLSRAARAGSPPPAVFGVDLSAAMLARARARFRRAKLPIRAARGDIRALPYRASSFGAVIAPYGIIQSLTSDADLEAALGEAARVLKKGGCAIVRGPNYFCFFEGHYRMFWFPMMGDSAFARFYLKIMKRPFEGLKTFHPVNPLKLRKYAREAGFKFVNIKRKQIYDGAKRRFPVLNGFLGILGLPAIYIGWETLQYIKNTAVSGVPLEYLLIKE